MFLMYAHGAPLWLSGVQSSDYMITCACCFNGTTHVSLIAHVLRSLLPHPHPRGLNKWTIHGIGKGYPLPTPSRLILHIHLCFVLPHWLIYGGQSYSKCFHAPAAHKPNDIAKRITPSFNTAPPRCCHGDFHSNARSPSIPRVSLNVTNVFFSRGFHLIFGGQSINRVAHLEGNGLGRFLQIHIPRFAAVPKRDYTYIHDKNIDA